MLSLTKTHAALCTLLLLALVTATGCGQKTDLRLHLKQGDKRTVHLTQTVGIKPSAGGMSFEFGSTTEFTCKFDIQDVSPTGEANAKVTFDAADLTGYLFMGSTALPGMDQAMGSVEKALRSIQGETFTCTIASDGKVTNVRGMDAVAKKAVSKLEIPNTPVFAMLKPEFTQELNDTLSNARMEKLWTGVFGFQPPKPVRVNGSWTVVTPMQSGGAASIPLTISQTLTLKSLQSGTATLASASTVTSDAAEHNVRGFKFKDIKGTESGSIDVDTTSGWLKKASSAMAITGSAELPTGMPGAAAGPAGGVSVTVEIKTLLDSDNAS